VRRLRAEQPSSRLSGKQLGTWEVTDMKRLIISPLVLALVLVSPLSAPVGAAG